MNLTMRALIAVVATAAIVGLAGAYLGAAALQDGSPDEPAAQPTPGDDTPSPAATTPIASGTPAPVPSDWKDYTDSALGFSLRYPPDLIAKDSTGPGPQDGWVQRVIEFRSAEDNSRAFIIGVYSNAEALTAGEWLQEYSACLPETVRQGSVAGQTAVFCTSVPLYPEMAVAFEHQGRMFYIAAVIDENEFESVLSSLLPSPSATTPVGTPVPVPGDWKEYTDPELGFTIFAPDGLERTESVFQLSEHGKIPATQLSVITFADPKGRWVVGVSETPNPAGLSLEDWIRTVPGWPCEPGASPTCEPEEVTVGGERGIRFSIGVIGDPTATVYLTHKDSIYVLHGNIHGDGQGPPLSEHEFMIFLERFRFGSTPAGTPVPVPSDWKEYTDPELGFSLRYPPDLTPKDLSSPGNSSGLSERVIDIRSGKNPSRAVSISVSSIDAHLTPRDWALKYTACIPDTISEGNVMANQAIFCTEQATEVTNAGVVIDHDGKIYHIGSLLTGEEFSIVLDSFRP